jgi:hypothetical protein
MGRHKALRDMLNAGLATEEIGRLAHTGRYLLQGSGSR